MVSDIKAGLMRPEYITMQQFECDDGFGCFELCKHAVETLAIDGEPKKMYAVDHVFSGDVFVDMSDGFQLKRKERLLYRLDTALFTPF